MSKLPTTVSELRPCDGCGGPITLIFYRVEVALHAVDVGEVQRVLGTQSIIGGTAGSLAVAEVLASSGSVVRTDESLKTGLNLCTHCYVENIAELVDREAAKQNG